MMILSQSDQDALDALVEARFDLEAVPERHRDRAERMLNLLSALDHSPEESPSEDLTARTLQRIERVRQPALAAAEPPAPPAERAFPGPPVSLRDLVAVAAIAIIAISVLWPMLASTRHSARQIACQANLAAAGHGLMAYAEAHDGAMPRAKARPGEDAWWFTGQFDEQGYPQSNSAHLYLLVRDGFAELEELACPGNPEARREYDPDMRDWADCSEASYSYQNQYTERPHNMQADPVIAALADKNPFFDRGEYNDGLRHDANSPNHTDSGQNVLMTDGRVSWLERPRLSNEDHIFHVGSEGRDRYTGHETPTGLADSFLVP